MEQTKIKLITVTNQGRKKGGEKKRKFIFGKYKEKWKKTNVFRRTSELFGN